MRFNDFQERKRNAGNIKQLNICGINQSIHVVFPTLFKPLLLTPVCWLLTHPWARNLTLHSAPDSAPLSQASSSARLVGLERPDNKQV